MRIVKQNIKRRLYYLQLRTFLTRYTLLAFRRWLPPPVMYCTVCTYIHPITIAGFFFLVKIHMLSSLNHPMICTLFLQHLYHTYSLSPTMLPKIPSLKNKGAYSNPVARFPFATTLKKFFFWEMRLKPQFPRVGETEWSFIFTFSEKKA